MMATASPSRLSGAGQSTAHGLEAELAERLERLERADRRRRLDLPAGVDFASNDYLGFGRDDELAAQIVARLEASRGVGMPVVGAPGSRLLGGHTEQHRQLESRLAVFKGMEAALFFPSGWQANVGLLTALVTEGDRVLSDRLNHASLIDGLRLARAQTRIYPHLDIQALEEELAKPWPGGRTFVLSESIFSMDGDIAPLDLYADLCVRHGAELIVDDAHALGLWGAERASGLVEHFGVERRVLAVTCTCGKSLGTGGAFLAGSRVLIDYLINACRPFIFSTATSPLLVHAVSAALDHLEKVPERRATVHRLADRLRHRLRAGGCQVPVGEGPIVPVLIGENRAALEVAEKARRAGFDVRAVRPPTVAPGTARLRLSVHADHDPSTIDHLADFLIEAGGGEP